MSNESFLRRWSRLKSQGGDAHAPEAPAGASMQYAGDNPEPAPPAEMQTHPPVAPVPPAAAPRQQPTIEDVAALGPDSDFSAFVSQGVDKTVQRLAMKKLFSDPHFNIMDGLDVYIDDYNKPDPIPAAMMASLNHARSVFAHMLDEKPVANGGQPEPPPRQDDA
ncbi:hypothetical protein GCM10027321_07130 [Massilia terrae]|uniref:DUF3306 domain-containing protein n=1 Tax=Massilia terrae TaxID=1811224 RepID=A0ABT2CSG7_9BURK|nr:DUF3306 domain-containing protein [Massilia terrae]MCS0656925.1 DUF3306 domain-containing protein [Massilia terrae]